MVNYSIVTTNNNMYVFLKSTDFMGQTGAYFKRKNLHHLTSNIHTIGQIVYASNNIVLKSLHGGEEIIVKTLNELIPEHGTYIHIYGNLSFFRDIKCTSWFNFDIEDDIQGNLSMVLNITCWKDLQHATTAKKLEHLLYTLNYNI